MTIHIFRSITRSILDYGAIVYNSASDTNLKSLKTITTEALRIASGANYCNKQLVHFMQ